MADGLVLRSKILPVASPPSLPETESFVRSVCGAKWWDLVVRTERLSLASQPQVLERTHGTDLFFDMHILFSRPQKWKTRKESSFV